MPTASLKGQDCDITPKATAPVPPSLLGCSLTSAPSSDPLSPLADNQLVAIEAYISGKETVLIEVCRANKEGPGLVLGPHSSLTLILSEN
jgi:hypothetical protein